MASGGKFTLVILSAYMNTSALHKCLVLNSGNFTPVTM